MATLLEEIRAKKAQQTQPPKKQQPGIGTQIVQGVAKPFLRGTTNLLNLVEAGQKLQQGDIRGAGQAATQTRDFGFLGRDIAPVTTPIESIGAGVEIGSSVVPVGVAGRAATQAAKTGIRTTGLSNLLKTAGQSAGLTGAASGLGATGAALQEPDMTAGQIAGRAALGAGLGAGVGFIAPIAGRAVQQVAARRGGKVAQEAERAIKAPKVAKELEEIGFQKDVQNLITKADDSVKNDMVDLFKRASQKSSSRLQAQPIYKLGSDFLSDMKVLSNEAKKAANTIKREVAKAQNVVTDLSRPRKNFVRELENFDVGITNDGKLLFDNSRIQNAADQKIVQDMFDFVSKPQGVKDVYRKNQALFDELKLGAKNNELSVAESAVSKLRSDLRKVVGSKLPINKEQQTYAKIEGLLSPINKALGSKYSPEDLATAKASEIIGRLLNRNAGRPTELLRDVIRESAKLQGKNPDKAWSDFLRKVEFTDVLEDVFGLAPSRSFKSQVGKGAADALTDVALDFVPYGGTIKTVAKGVFGKEKPLRDKQIEALKDLLRLK